MSFEGFNVIACVPAGRRRVMDPLLKHLRVNSHLIDRVHLWQNTDNADDLEWMRKQADDYVHLIPLDYDEPPRIPKQLNTGRFYQYATDPDTVYIRFDDDIVWIAPDAIESLLRLRLEQRDPFVVFATIWNNAVISSIAQELGIINGSYGHVDRYCMDPVGWKDPEFGEYVHRTLLMAIEAGTVDQLKFGHTSAVRVPQGNRPLPSPLRFSVSCFVWFGSDMALVADELWAAEEEQFISGTYPDRTGRFNLIAGDALVSHYSFFTQRAHLDTTDILTKYQDLADNAYHDAYYRLLGES